MRKQAAMLTLLCLSVLSAEAASFETPGGLLRVDITKTDSGTRESIQVKDAGRWLPALSVIGSAPRVTPAESSEPDACKTRVVLALGTSGILIRADCGTGTLERRITAASEPDVVDISVKFIPKPGAKFRSVEDRYDFMPERRSSDSPLAGPLDFVWSQNIKADADDVVSSFDFKSPVVMFQQDRVFSALMPKLNSAGRLPLALELDATSAARPWLWRRCFEATWPQLF